MTYQISDFSAQVALAAKTFPFYANRLSELNAIAAALNPDPTTHDTTIQTAPTGLQFGNAANTDFTDDVLRVVNRGKGGNLTPAAMSAAITSGLGQVVPPTNTTAPSISYSSGGGGAGTQPGAIYARNPGVWTPSGATITQQWQRNGTPIAGQTGITYTTQAADAGTNLSCLVTATNGAGSASATSNSVAIT